MIISGFLFLVLGMSIIMIEAKRRPDLLSLFVFIFSLQVVIPGVLIPSLLWLIEHPPELGNYFFDRIYRDVTPEVVLLCAVMAILFAASLYYGFAIGYRRPEAGRVPLKRVLDIRSGRFTLVLMLGMLSSVTLLGSMPGEGFFAKYASLVLFRAQHEVVAEMRNFLTANLFALTQTFALLSILGFLMLKDRHGWKGRLLLPAMVGLIIFFGVLTASRRMLPIQAILIYFAYILISGKWRLKQGFLIGLVFFPILVFGKDFLAQFGSVAVGKEVVYAFEADKYLLAALNGLSSLGITLNSSWATFLYLDSLPLRFGMDHWVTAIRFLPLGSLGVDEDALLPERIVRLSTEAFVGSQELDIPPGIIGQMWLDFGALGPVIWGVVFGVAIGWVQRAFDRYERTWVSSGVFSVLIFFVALPLNTGSVDFNLSVDMFFLLLALYLISRVRAVDEQRSSRPNLDLTVCK